MLTTPRAQLIEKMITSAEGIVFKAVFLVYEEEGRMKARLVQAVPVSKKAQPVVFALTGHVHMAPAPEVIIREQATEAISPYTSFLYFVGSKPRAPSIFA